MQQPVSNQPKYFDIIRALHRGALSLWLNRKTFMPMTLVPTLVTFLTLMVMRVNFMGEGMEQPSAFTMALMQIPADFVTGLFCALIIFIIVNAPKKDDKQAPVVFTLNIMERKDLLLAAAGASVIISYIGAGLLGIMQMIFDQIKAAAELEQSPNMIYTIAFFIIVGFIIYAVRFVTLPVLIIAKIDIAHFYMRYRAFGFSLPILAIKFLVMLAVGGVAVVLASVIANANGDASATPTQMALVDFVTAFGSVAMSAWVAASLAIGIRRMMER